MIKIIRNEKEASNIPSDLYNAALNIFKNNQRCNVILLSDTKYTKAIAISGEPLYPLLDDIAQMTGTSIKSVRSFLSIKNKLTRKNALFIKDMGCICCGSDIYEAEALSMVIEKGAMAEITSSFIGGGKRIKGYEALLMRLIYLYKYSKKSKRKINATG